MNSPEPMPPPEGISPKMLAGQKGANSYVELRPLTADEIKFHDESRPLVCEVRSRFKLFKILELNYNEWAVYHRSLLAPGAGAGDNLLILDRLMFNFLTTAYSLMEHFEASYKRRYRRNLDKIKQYDDMLSRMCSSTWAFAFFLDYRNYAQHCDLPIGAFHRSENEHSVTISITHNADQLLSADKRVWKRCGLRPKHGKLDLITLTRDYYMALRGSYGGFMTMCFYPELVGIDRFYMELTQELRKSHSGARMIFMTKKAETRQQNTLSTTWDYEYPPNALYDELGISI